MFLHPLLFFNLKLMFRTKNLVHDIKDVPGSWIFEHYCKLNQKLNGQHIKIKSLFNEEKTPSMCIYTDEYNTYRYKDFSSGKSGFGVNLVKDVYNLKYHQACIKIIEDYNDYVLKNGKEYEPKEIKKYARFKVTGYTKRSWTTKDQYYWTQFNIGSRLLEEHCIFPLESYIMEKDIDKIEIKGSYIYGYFKKDGTLYKVYQPKTLDKKFINVKSHIQGLEQIKPPHINLLITSSLKDLMSIKSLKLSSLNIVAADSENTMIPSANIECWQKEYQNIIIMFDNDEAGIEAMQKYKEKYPFIKVALLPLSKDISDSIKDHGVKKVREHLVPILNKKINETQEGI
jgi:hypothetical protein